jgi:hypothetical protein
MYKIPDISINNLKIGSYYSLLNVCQDGYSTSNTPVSGFDNSEILARVNESYPLISTDGNYHNEILKSVFNIGIKKAESKPLWIIPNSIRQRGFIVQNEQPTTIPSAATGAPDCTLHRQFAALVDKDIKHKVKFANKYGLLRRHAAHNLIFRNPNTGNQLQMGESLIWWQEEIIELASCIKLFDAISCESKQIKDIVLWHRDGITLKLENGDIQLVSMANMHLMGKWTEGDTKGPVLHYLSLEMDKRLTDSLTPKISSDQNDLYVYPDTLLSAIWLMFLLEITGNINLLQCKICGDFFRTQDPRAQFCSTRCRVRNFRNRKSQDLQKQKNMMILETRPWRDSNPRPAA